MGRVGTVAARRCENCEVVSIARERVRINEEIRASEVRVIDADGTQIGIMPTSEALELAYDRGLDLIEIAPHANPPVCRLQDYGKYRFEQTKREKEARRARKKVEIKEIRLRPKTGEHDIAVRIRNARRFLESGAKVKVWMRFRGREVTHPEVAIALLRRIADELSDVGTIEQQPARRGRTMLMILTPVSGKKKRSQPKSQKESEASAEGEAKSQKNEAA